MVSKKSRQEVRVKKHMKIRNRLSGTAECPRLAVFRSNNHMSAQIIDDTVGNTLVSASTTEKEIKKELVVLIDSVTEASENLLEKLHEDDIMDITTDIKKLQTTLANKGLLDSDFDIK